MVETLHPDEEVEGKIIPILGMDTPENARKIKEGVHLEGVTIDVVEDREEFGKLVQVPERVPEGEVLLYFRISAYPDRTPELMRQIVEVLNS